MNKRFKYLLCIAFVLGTILVVPKNASAAVKIDATNFPDEGLRKVVSSSLTDKNMDGILSDEELKAVTAFGVGELEAGGNTITSLKGLEHFPNITVLHIDKLKITENILSYFPKLEKLVLSDCEVSLKGTALYLKDLETFGSKSATFSQLELQANNLKSIKLSCSKCPQNSYLKAPNLESIELWNGQKEIDDLGIEFSIKKLKKLTFRYGAATNLKLSGYTALETLYLYQCNDVKSLNAGGLKNLKRLDLFYCENLKKLDLSDSKKLIRLECVGTFLRSLNIKKNTKLARLKVKESKLKTLNVKNNKNLKFLDITKTPIKSIDLSKNKKLSYFSYINTKISKLDLSKNKKLRKLGLNGSKTKQLILPNVSSKMVRVDYDSPTFGHNAKTGILDLSNFKSLEKIKGNVWSNTISLEEDFCKKSHSLKKVVINKKLKKSDKKYIKKLAKKCKAKVVTKK